jgi:L,D-transpeptidase catalytic domain
MPSGTVLPASLLTAALAAACAAPARAEIVVNIDKNTQSMTVAVDGSPRYIWPVSTGRPGYDTPNGAYRPNRMDADHLSQEWDNAPMPHSIFFDLHGHAIHGFLDTSRIGSAASHGCVRLSPEHAAALYELVSTEGMKETTVIVSGHTPVGRMPEVARRSAPVENPAGQPMQIAPGYEQTTAYGQPPTAYGLQPPPGYTQQQPPPGYGRQQAAPYDAQAVYRQAQPMQPFNGLFGQAGYPPPPPSYAVQPYSRY